MTANVYGQIQIRLNDQVTGQAEGCALLTTPDIVGDEKIGS